MKLVKLLENTNHNWFALLQYGSWSITKNYDIEFELFIIACSTEQYFPVLPSSIGRILGMDEPAKIYWTNIYSLNILHYIIEIFFSESFYLSEHFFWNIYWTNFLVNQFFP